MVRSTTRTGVSAYSAAEDSLDLPLWLPTPTAVLDLPLDWLMADYFTGDVTGDGRDDLVGSADTKIFVVPGGNASTGAMKIVEATGELPAGNLAGGRHQGTTSPMS